MKLEVMKRTSGKKGETNRLRRGGNIPAILYNSKGETTAISLKTEEMQAVLRSLKPGLLATTLFELNLEGRSVKAIVKDVQYHVASYDIEHVDFLQVTDKEPVTVNVPIQLLGAGECAGVKQGGFVRQIIRTLKVTCVPKNLPQEFTIDVRDLGLAQSKTLADIALPTGVQPRARMSEVAVIIGKKAGT